MTLSELCKSLELEHICGELNKDFCGVYCGDFLSRAMGKAKQDNLWVTIMNNPNCIAVASLSDVAAIVLAEGVHLSDDALDAAKENDITVLSSKLPAYELCIAIGGVSEKNA